MADGIVGLDAATGQVRMSVSGIANKTVATGPRDSIRLTSKATFQSGLFIVDLAHMPTGCGTWPAFWLVGPGWPNDGEIDIIEGVNKAASDTTTLHSSQGCSQAGVADSEFTGKRSVGKNGQPATDCWVNDPNEFGNQGCGISAGAGSYGAPFNAAAGGVYATMWTEAGVSSWFFPRKAIPGNIASGQPDPTAWGKPYAKFDFGSSCAPSHFAGMQLVFDLVLCGDWAGGVFQQNCPGLGSCEDFTNKHPEQLTEAYWLVNALSVYSST